MLANSRTSIVRSSISMNIFLYPFLIVTFQKVFNWHSLKQNAVVYGPARQFVSSYLFLGRITQLQNTLSLSVAICYTIRCLDIHLHVLLFTLTKVLKMVSRNTKKYTRRRICNFPKLGRYFASSQQVKQVLCTS